VGKSKGPLCVCKETLFRIPFPPGAAKVSCPQKLAVWMHPTEALSLSIPCRVTPPGGSEEIGASSVESRERLWVSLSARTSARIDARRPALRFRFGFWGMRLMI
jgi:hypothetical protein